MTVVEFPRPDQPGPCPTCGEGRACEEHTCTGAADRGRTDITCHCCDRSCTCGLADVLDRGRALVLRLEGEVRGE